MKKTIKFTGDPYEDAEEFEIIENSGKTHAVLFEIVNNFNKRFIKNSEESDDFISGMSFLLETILEEVEINGLEL
jgi:hypothetical protein